ncbi:uncharacterized protein ARMOST_14929 [Armillaria ostoyae]|uniref:Uncharacterized protein n=1 Tax=Armillaria ostoyae TaxID=47428 RepID=A0A284RS51_ARMOS|nr:uncharacterized protein ARMOST_14929 [Armillaria ostoyae]
MKQTKGCNIGAILRYLRKVYDKALRILRATIQAEGDVGDTSLESPSLATPRMASWEAQRIVRQVDDLEDEATVSSTDSSGVV